MLWLKKNLTLVVAGVVALVLLGFSGYFLYGKMTRASAVQTALDAQRTELERLNNLKPHPGNAKVDNIAAAREQNGELKVQLGEFKTTFTPFDVATDLSSGEFSSRLLQTIAELRQEAGRAGIKLGTNFAFGFAGIRNKFSFKPDELPVHIEQLAHVRAISEALIAARVLTIDSIKRPAMPKKEEPSTTGSMGMGLSMGAPAPAPTTTEEPSEDHWSREAQANEVAVLHPYEITFQAFTPELGRFLDALALDPHCIVAKNVAVDTASSSLLSSPMSMDPWSQYGMGGAAAAGRGAMDPGMAARYGLGGGAGGAGADAGMMARYGLGQTPGAGMGFGRGPVVRGNKTILLDEHPFRVRAWLYVVVPLPEAESGGGLMPAAGPTMADPSATRY